MLEILRTTLLIGLLLTSLLDGEQKRPSFSGDWSLESATKSGGARGERSNRTGETSVMTNTAGGAAFNCGRECKVVHKTETLTIEKALLGSNEAPAPLVTLRLDGQRVAVVDSFSPNRHILTTAHWTSNGLEIVSSSGSLTFRQLLSIEGTRLIVVTALDREGSSPVTFRYKRK